MTRVGAWSRWRRCSWLSGQSEQAIRELALLVAQPWPGGTPLELLARVARHLGTPLPCPRWPLPFRRGRRGPGRRRRVVGTDPATLPSETSVRGSPRRTLGG